MSTETYAVAGLKLASPVRLAAPTAGGPPDWTIDFGDPRLPPPGRSDDELVSELAGPDKVLYRVTAGPGRRPVMLEFPGLADFEIHPAPRTVVAHAHPDSDPGLLPILVTGTLTALLLSLAGEIVLHASAVEVAGAAVAFVGGSGQGKTTVAALCCTAGYPLVADDLLVVRVSEDGSVHCLRGSGELRLRPRVDQLADLLAGAGSGRYLTADGRHAVAPPATALERLPLGTVAVPLPQRGPRDVGVSTLGPGQAMVTLLRSQRIAQWRSPEVAKARMGKVARIAAVVPVKSLLVPWGPPWDPGMARSLVSALADGTDPGTDPRAVREVPRAESA
jgi:hypothetical protein